MRLLCILLIASGAAFGEVHTLSLQQALARAARQNPDVALARLDAERAKHDVQIAGDVFSSKMTLRGDAVYTDGYPNSIGPDTHSPSILHQQTDRGFFNRPQHYQVAAAKQDAAGAEIGPKAKADDVAHQIASLYLDVEEALAEKQALQTQAAAYRNMEAATASKVKEGYLLPVEDMRSKLETAQALERLHSSEGDLQYSESLIAVALGFTGNDLVVPAEREENFHLPSMTSEGHAVTIALTNNKALQQLRSGLLAKRLERKSFAAFHLPQADLVEQYSLFAERTYRDYFPSDKFQRNNAELGVSFTLPILIGLEPKARLNQAYIDEEKIQVQINDLTHRIRANTVRSLQELKKAQGDLNVAQQQLDLAHDEQSVVNAQFQEGRALPTDAERAVNTENEKQLAVFRQQAEVQRAKLNVLQQLGGLMDSLNSSRP